MELLQLQYFLVVARLEHVTEAARSLHVTQSSLSKTIGRLEEDLGVPLFDRVGRKLRLNEYGNKFFRRAERALFELEQGKQELRDLSSPEQGTLELAVTAASALPHILREFRKKRPHVQFHVQMLTTQEMVKLLHQGDVDVCLSSPPSKRRTLNVRSFTMTPFLLLFPKGTGWLNEPAYP
nr:LysR family transcriptional regulator [Paenibacillus sonchi]